MKRVEQLLQGLLGVLALLAVFFWMGPRPSLPAHAAECDRAVDLQAKLGAEADVPEPVRARVRWAGDAGAKTPVSLVYLHGFSATRQEIAPVPERAAKALGANLFEARLTGHGLGGEQLGATQGEAWLVDTEEALAIGRQLGERTVLIGVSTGGTLATWAAATCPEQVAGLVLLSPNFAIGGPGKLLTAPWGAQLRSLLLPGERAWEGENEQHNAYWTTRYPTPVLTEMAGLVNTVADLKSPKTPALVGWHPDDCVIDPGAIERRVATWPAPVTRWDPDDAEDPCHHVLAGDVLSPGANDSLVDSIVWFARGLPTE